MSFFRKKQASEPLDPQRIPQHVAIVMDGNGRWAKRRHLPRSGGHAAGAETLRSVASHAKELGIRYLTVYAFSTENWKRPREEVDAIMGLLKNYLLEALEDMEKNQIHMVFLGNLSPLDANLQELCVQVEERSRRFTQYQLNICLNYGSRDEIVRAAQAFAADCVGGRGDPHHLTEEAFGKYLFTAGIPDPDLIIRPSGEVRLSNFLLWQAAYSEFYFTDVCWPDFKKKHLEDAVRAYQARQRRFGGT